MLRSFSHNATKVTNLTYAGGRLQQVSKIHIPPWRPASPLDEYEYEGLI